MKLYQRPRHDAGRNDTTLATSCTIPDVSRSSDDHYVPSSSTDAGNEYC